MGLAYCVSSAGRMQEDISSAWSDLQLRMANSSGMVTGGDGGCTVVGE